MNSEPSPAPPFPAGEPAIAVTPSVGTVQPSSMREQLFAFMQLRWRIRTNQLRRDSGIGKAIAALMAASMVLATAMFFVFGITIGITVPMMAGIENAFFIWDAFSVIFFIAWCIYVLTDISRTDAITFDRVSHLPVSLKNAFLVNYVSSMFNLPLMCFVALSVGTIVASVFTVSWRMIFMFVPWAAYMVMLTALTYQLTGWIATLMANPRRRQMIMVGVPLVIVFLCQLPSVVITRIAGQRDRQSAPVAAPLDVPPPAVVVETETVPPATVDPPPALPQPELVAPNPVTPPSPTPISRAQQFGQFRNVVKSMNVYIPPLWLAASAESIQFGNWNVVWVTFLFSVVAYCSLKLNYRSTVRYYRGETPVRPKKAASNSVGSGASTSWFPANGVLLVERRFPWVSEDASAVMAMTLRSMSRAAEVKMFMLLPFIAPVAFLGAMTAVKIPAVDELKAVIAFAIAGFGLFVVSGMFGNQFGYDRSGFRAFVLSPMDRKDILLGRNIAMIVFPFLVSQAIALFIGVYFGMSFDKFVANAFLVLTFLPIYCLVMNTMSIYATIPIASGTIQPTQVALVPVAISLLLSMTLPVFLVVIALPLGIEWLLDRYVSATALVPWSLILSMIACSISIAIYRLVLPIQSTWLVRREKEILRVVTSKVE